MNPPDLIVIGGPSLDRIRIRGVSHDIIGGAGYLTALAARAAGARVGLVARVPRSLPGAVSRGFGPGRIDPGGLVPTDGGLPRFTIRYDSHERATYESVEPGVECDTRAKDVPQRWLAARHVHLSPLGGGSEQLSEFLGRLRARGFRGSSSAGTYPRAVAETPTAVRDLFAAVDLAFLNQSEFDALYPSGPPAETEFVVTAGTEGVAHWAKGQRRHTPAQPIADVVDPTGAGDSFCGGFLAARLAGGDPVATGQRIAAVALSDVGGEALRSRLGRGQVVAFEVAENPGVARVDAVRVAEVAKGLASEATGSALDFCGFPFPERDDPRAMEVFALATLHQFGFWTGDDDGYVGPMWATADGKRFKGSDFVWQAFTRAAAADPSVLDPQRLAAEPLLFDRVCVADDGECPIPAAGAHRELQQGYGAAMAELDDGIATLVERANASEKPAQTMLDALAKVPGYAEDSLAKKAILLVLILANRPEGFLDLRDPESLGPIVDYHLMRGCLRTGCVTITDSDLLDRMENRAWVSAGEEAAVRSACFDALGRLCDASGLTVAQIDGFFFVNGRKRCLETQAAKCDECPLASHCAQAIDLFQPIFRTTAY